ncbi:MAG: HlyD family efflux transporter periplasmic adaptor subunit [Planctomycetota bacterium]
MFYPQIFMLSIALFGSPEMFDDPPTWRPFDHPVVAERSFTAFTRPIRTLSIVSAVPQRVVKITLDEGDLVPGRPDEMIAVAYLDSTVEKELLRGSMIALEITQNEAVKSQLLVEQAQVAAQIASREQKRIQDLHNEGNATESDLDRVNLEEQQARTALEVAKSTKLDAQSAVKAAETEVAVIEARIDRLILKAPGGWRVEQRLVEPGAGVVPGAILLVIADLSAYEIEIPMAEDEIRALATMPLRIRRVADDTELNGTITFVGAIPDPRTLRRRVVIRIPAEELTLEPPETGGGLEVQTVLEVADRSGGVRIPRRFLSQRLEQWLVKTQEGKTYVVTPVRFDDSAWIVLPGELPGGAVLVEP